MNFSLEVKRADQDWQEWDKNLSLEEAEEEFFRLLNRVVYDFLSIRIVWTRPVGT